jgi:phage terminase small subunit
MRRLPASVLEAKGAFEKNPERKRVDPVAIGDLGNAPSYFDKDEKDIWKELKSQLPQGLAKSADRFMVEIACKLMRKFRTAGLNSSELSQLINALGRLGMSPADRSKCAMAPEPPSKENTFQEFV